MGTEVTFLSLRHDVFDFLGQELQFVFTVSRNSFLCRDCRFPGNCKTSERPRVPASSIGDTSRHNKPRYQSVGETSVGGTHRP